MNMIDMAIDSRTNKIVKYNTILHSIVDYRKVKMINNSEYICTTLPVVRRLSNKELIKLVLQGMAGACMIYIMLVMIIGSAPIK